jgi:sulfide dehydrogenase [flavocytochrome c] flavoprotein subunit
VSAFNRRDFLSGALGAMAIGSRRASSATPAARIGIVGGGFGGASLARYLRRHDPKLSITLIERDAAFSTCPFSNGVIAGLYPLEKITFGYETLRAAGIEVIHAEASSADPVRKTVRLNAGRQLQFDFLVLSPGIDFIWEGIEGYSAEAAERMPHAWRAGAQTQLLHRQIEAMPDGGLLVIAVPPMPYRCPPGPYERASLIANYFKGHKPKSKILILDSSDAFIKQDLFMQSWQRLYPGMIEWVPGSNSGKVLRVDPKTLLVSTGFDDHRPAVANIIPAQRAGRIAVEAGLDAGTGYCAIHPKTFESKQHRGVYVLGDAAIAGEMPKSGFSANNQAKACGRAILAALAGRSVAPAKLLNICYSFARPDYAFSIVDGFEVSDDAIKLSFSDRRTTPLDAGEEEHRLEAESARSWYANITADMFG